MKLFTREPKTSNVFPSAGAHTRAPRVLWGGGWYSVEPTASTPLQKAAKTEARKRGATKYVISSNGQDAFVGVPAKGKSARTSGASGTGHAAYLSAQLLATVRQAKEVLYVGEDAPSQNNPWNRIEQIAYLGALDEATFVFVATIDGVPFMDICGNADTVGKAVEDFKEHLVRGAALLIQDARPVAVTFSSLPNEFPGAARAVPGLPYDAKVNEVLAPLQSLGIHPAVKGLVGTAGILGACAAALWAYDAYVGHTLSVEQLTRKEQIARTIRQKYLTAQQESLTKESAVVANSAAEPLWAFIAKTTTSRAGFYLNKVVCTGGTCDVLYRRDSKQPTFTDFVRTHAQGELPRFDIAQLDDATTGIEIPGYDKLPVLDLAEVKHDPELLLKLGTTAQKVLLGGVKLSFTTPADMVPTAEEYKTMRPGDLAVARRLYGSWTLEGPTDTFTAALGRLPPSATLSVFEIRLAKSEKDGPDIVVARGRYFLTPAERMAQ